MNMSQIMTSAWNLYKSDRSNIGKFNRRAFGRCLETAWSVTKFPRVYVYDTRPMSDRGHMYQALA